LKLRTGVVLKISDIIREEGHMWYKVTRDDWVRYPERVTSEWYVEATSSVRISKNTAEELPASPATASTSKHIVVDRSDQTLSAYDGDTLFMQEAVSTGLELTPTPRGTFTVYKKTPSRYMQGPLPGISDQYYDLPGVPWNLYFTYQGGVIHGAYWHTSFGQRWSHGCVNLPPDQARTLYEWADVGTPVLVRD
jgi:lipoprotein-anchoring transpeptidase ErfK/SrfK